MPKVPRTTDSRQRLLIDWPRNRYAFADADGAISLRRRRDDTELSRLKAVGGGVEYWRSFSADGRWLGAAYKDHRVRFWNLENATVAWEWRDVSASDFSPDSRQLAVATSDDTITLFDLDGSGGKRTFGIPSAPADTTSIVHLISPQTGGTLAQLPMNPRSERG
ncbi:MAG: WD40 repeat domain-containing protein [Limisphaerales bacterium]